MLHATSVLQAAASGLKWIEESDLLGWFATWSEKSRLKLLPAASILWLLDALGNG